MKIEVNADREIELSEVYNAVAIKTEAGTFGICERDGGIEILRGGVMVFACYTKPDEGIELPAPHFRQCTSTMRSDLDITHRCELAAGHEGEHMRQTVDAPHLWRDPTTVHTDGTPCP